MKVLILGNGNPLKILLAAFKKEGITVLGVQQDKPLESLLQKEFTDFLADHNLPLVTEGHPAYTTCDVVFVMNYNRIINLREFAGKKVINLHMGLLPVYRGNNANAWAVMNGEKRVGYTLHAVTDLLDAGDVYYKFEYDIGADKTYYNAKQAIENDIALNTGIVLSSIYNGQLTAASQEGSGFIYCSRLRPSDGIIKNWDQDTEWFIRRHYVFGKPLGTGLKFSYKGNLFTIADTTNISGFLPSAGVTGAVLYIHENSLWIKTKDTAVSLSGITIENGGEIRVKDFFKIGVRL
jgi:methionyl-tRNA formyltransferase